MLVFKGRRKDNNEWVEGPLDLNALMPPDDKAWIEVNGERHEIHTEDLVPIGEAQD